MRVLRTCWVRRVNTLHGAALSQEQIPVTSPIGRMLSNPRVASVTITYDTAIGGSRTYYRDEPPKEGK